VDTNWHQDQPTTEQKNQYRQAHDEDAYAKWFLAKYMAEEDNEKDHYIFPHGDFHKVHRSGIIVARNRAKQYQYSDVVAVAEEILELIDSM